MNLTNDEAAKVIETALEDAHQHFLGMLQMATGPLTKADAEMRIQRNREALAILQAAKDRPQPEPVAWMDEFGNCLSVTQLSLTDKKVAQHYTTPLYTHPPQPAVDARAWLLSRGMWPEQLSSRINLGDTAQAPTMLELFTEFAAKSAAPASQPAVDKLIEAGNLLESATRQAYADNECPQEQINNSYALNAWTAAKSAAPVDPPKVLTDEVIERYANTFDGAAQIAVRKTLKHARDNGYLAPVAEPKVSQDEYDRMSFVMRGGVTPISAKVDVDAVISAVEQWHEDAGEDPESGLHAFDLLEISPFRAKAISDLRSRLTKLFNA
jgi:hypothetical protein